MEAKLHDVQMHRLDINKSGTNFDIVDDQIYFGISKIKGIGEAVAERIVANQPYKSFEDFLYKLKIKYAYIYDKPENYNATNIRNFNIRNITINKYRIINENVCVSV